MAHTYNRKPPPFYNGGLGSVLRAGANRGQTFYVNGTDWGDGDNGNDGLRPDTPFLTLTYALAQCTDEEFDTIVVVDYWTPTGETWPIAVDKRQVTILGAPGGSYDRWACVHPSGNTAAFEIQAAGVRIVDFYIDAGAAHAGIEYSGTPERTGVYGCSFMSGTYGVDMGVNEAGFGAVVEDCHFSTYLTAGGIIVGNQTRARVKNCVFMRTGGVAIEVTNSAPYSQILDNRIAMNANTAGRAITLAANTVEIMVDGNSAFWGETVGQNPYLDNAAADVNCWGVNYHGNTMVLPT